MNGKHRAPSSSAGRTDAISVQVDHDHGAAELVDALAQRVLAEAACALEHVGERLQRALGAVMTRTRRPLSNSASTASCSVRFRYG
jgi:hypothetical protein